MGCVFLQFPARPARLLAARRHPRERAQSAGCLGAVARSLGRATGKPLVGDGCKMAGVFSQLCRKSGRTRTG